MWLCLSETNQDPVTSSSNVLEGNVVLFFLALYHVFKSMEPLLVDSPAETDVVRRSITAKVFVAFGKRAR